jgi:hypothetical protein
MLFFSWLANLDTGHPRPIKAQKIRDVSPLRPATARNELMGWDPVRVFARRGVRSGGRRHIKMRRPPSSSSTPHLASREDEVGRRNKTNSGRRGVQILLRFTGYHDESILQPDLYFSWRRGEAENC